MKQAIANRYKSDFLVLLEEEYGYRRWFWFPDMSPMQLELWWKKLETVDAYFMTPEPLPGNLYQVETDDEFDLFNRLELSSNYHSAHIHCDDDSVLILPNKSEVFHRGYEE